MSDPATPCTGCSATVHLTRDTVERILADYLAGHPQPRAGAGTVAARTATCRACPDLLYGTTCRHCGCLVEVLAHLAQRACPHPGGARW